MQSVTLYRYWQFGTGFRYLQDAKEGYSIHGSAVVIGNIEALLKKLEDLNLYVTIRAAANLRSLLKDLKATPGDSKLDAAQARKLSSTVRALRQTLEAELKGVNAYVVSPKRIEVERLVSDPASLFAPDVFNSLSELARFDIAEAAKCIAFERPTAAAFHLMRATEEALRNYYCHFVKRDRLSVMMWGPMVQALQKHRRAKQYDVLNKNLDNVRTSFRNPTQHPDKVYDIHEVQDLWGLCVEVINRMERAKAEA
ncbi:hypothetical protein ACFO3A_06085 [Comamonas nitrativorans]|uniref:HEPN domain-containing protein n=1 Tax=Comamonas nitrativorans TaxID=108437 RepID=A0ABV9GUS1_9BURK